MLPVIIVLSEKWMVGVSAFLDLPLHHKVQKFSSGTGSPVWFQKKGRKMVVVVVVSEQWMGSAVCSLTTDDEFMFHYL